jgi:TRAP transporter 4TM/12TM fusion protein
MNSLLRRLAYLVFLLAGAVVLAAPVIREVDPTSLLNSQLSLVQFLVLELHAALLAYWAHRAATRDAPVEVAGAVVLAAASATSGIWMFQFMGTDAAVFLAATPSVIGFGCTTIALVLISGLGAAGKPLILIVFGFLTFGYFGQFVPQLASVPQTQFTSYVTYLAYGSDGLFGLALDIIANIVLAFVIFGAFFEISGGGRVIVNIAMRLALNSRSNAIKACVISSGLFGTISGAAISNVLTSGAFTIPGMRKIGVRNETAAGIEAAASTCGQIMPPVLGAAAFFMADLAGVPYTTVVLASIGPALACYYAFFRQADLVVLDASETAAAIAPEPFERSWLLFILPPAAIVYFLLKSSIYISVAAIAGIAMCLLISLLFQGWRLSLVRFREKFPALVKSAAHLIIIAAAIGLLLGALYSTGLTVAGAIMLGKLGENSLAIALIVAAGAAFVLGMGVATVGVYIVAATLLTPGLIDSGVPPLAAHFFVLYCAQLSMITPPVALASLAASSLAEASFGATSREAMRFGWMLFVIPFIIVLRPGLLGLGPWDEILVSFIVTFIFITVVTSTHLGRWIKLGLVLVSTLAIAWNGPQWVALALSIAALPFLFFKNVRVFRFG